MRTFFFLFICTAFFSCEIKVKTGTSSEEEMTGSKIRNHVELKNNGLEAEQAFLVFEDGKLGPMITKLK